MSFRAGLKKIKVIAEINSLLRARSLKFQNSLFRFYYNCIKIAKPSYDEARAQVQVKKRFDAIGVSSKCFVRRPRAFWVGANWDQDVSGFLPALRRLCDTTCFINEYSEYGLWYGDEIQKRKKLVEDVIESNSRALLRQVKNLNDGPGIDFLIGQMWSNYISPSALLQIKEMGVPIINISMDDRLPANWQWKRGYRLGSVGLSKSVDLVLTTVSEVCPWYAAEGCEALYFPLASDPSIFSNPDQSQRDIDVVFVGNRYGVREKIVSRLEGNGIRVDAWGHGWVNGYVSSREAANLFKRAKIILGVGTVGHCSDVYTMKLRDFDAPMSGGLYITNKTSELSDAYEEGKEIIFYESLDECANLIKFYLHNSDLRQEVARAGQLRAIKQHTWDARLEKTFKDIGCLIA